MELNHDCLVEIFQYLPIRDRIRYERVSKLWKEASETSWRSFKNLNLKDLKKSTNLFPAKNHKFNENLIFFNLLKRTGKFLQNVDITSAFGKYHEIKYKNELNLSSVIQYLSIYCENILELSVSGCNLKNPDEIFTALFLRNKGLKCLEIYHSNLNGNCFLCIPADIEKLILVEVQLSPIFSTSPVCFNNLKSFKLINEDYERHYDDSYMNNVLNFLSKSLLKSAPKMTEIVIKQSSEIDDLSDSHVVKWFSRMKNLKKVVLGNFYMGDDIFDSLPKNSVETMIIDTLDFYASDLDESLPTFENLKTLGLHKITFDEDFAKAISLCKNIRFLQISSIFGYNVSLADANKMFHGLINLEILDISMMAADKIGTNDEFLKIIGSNCKSLKAINLRQSDYKSINSKNKITDIGLNFITSIEGLQILEIGNLEEITDKPLSFMPNIKELYCKNNDLKNDGLIKLLKTSPYLQKLDVSKCKKIDKKLIDTAIETINVRKNNLIIYLANSGIDRKTIDVPSSIILKDEFELHVPDIFNLVE